MSSSAQICPEGVNRLAKNLARDLPLSLEQQIIAIRREGAGWLLSVRSGQFYQARQVLISCPVPQAAELFKLDHPNLADRLQNLARDLQYRPQWAAIISAGTGAEGMLQSLAVSYQPSPAPGLASLHEQIPGHVWVVQTDQEFSTKYLEDQPEVIVERIGDALRATGIRVENQQIQAHRWRFARVAKPLQQAFLAWDDAPGLCWAGDFCLASTVIDAAFSGLSAANYLIARRSLS
jgi:predicted NAD/FAD-dependent oxidoreductase